MVFRTTSGFGSYSPDDDIVGFRPGIDSVAIPLVASAEASELSPAISPNGRWLAYTSDLTGQREVYVVPFPDVDSADPVLVSRAGGRTVLWAHSGTELFFVDAREGFVAAEVRADSVFRVLSSVTLFSALDYSLFQGTDNHDIGPDEQFLMLRRVERSGESNEATRLILVENWFTELRQRMTN